MSARFSSSGVRAVTAAALAAVAVAGCGSSNSASSSSGGSKMANMPGMSGSSGSMANMTGMGGAKPNPTSAAALNTKGVSLGGLHPIPTQLLASATWQGMKIQAYATTAVPFFVYNGTALQEVKPSKSTSFHLMVMLTDSYSGYAIPYSTVWATIKRAGKVVYDERQYPMISRYMGPHYGNDVTVPGAGTYQLSLLVSPPVSARHIEYQNVWLTPHRQNFTFHWTPPKAL